MTRRYRIYLSLATGPETYAWGAPIPLRGRDCERETCPVEGCAYGSHDALWHIERVPLDTGLYWSAARINGERELIEGSLPNVVTRIPRDATRLDPAECHALWVTDNESHTFGGPNIARALRESIAAHNAEVLA